MIINKELLELYLMSTVVWIMFGLIYGINNFHNRKLIHILHAIITCILLSYTEDMYSLSFSFGYFSMDILSCLYNKDILYSFHALAAILLISRCVFDQSRYDIGMAKVLYIELSTPFLYLWRYMKTRSTLLLFASGFIATRIIFLPLITYMAFTHKFHWDIIVLTILTVLNYKWFGKIVPLIMNYKNSN